LATAFWLLRIVLGSGLFLAGLDKFFDLITNWSMYMSPLAERWLPVGEKVFLHAVGILEMALGLGVLTGLVRWASYAVAAWLLAIAANLALSGNFLDLCLRDLEIATAAFVLGRLTAWRREVLEGLSAPGEPGYEALARRLEGEHPARPG